MYPTAVVDLFEKQAGPVHDSLGQVDPGQTNAKIQLKVQIQIQMQKKIQYFRTIWLCPQSLGKADVAILRPVSHVGKYPEGIYESSLGRSHTRIPRETVVRSRCGIFSILAAPSGIGVQIIAHSVKAGPVTQL